MHNPREVIFSITLKRNGNEVPVGEDEAYMIGYAVEESLRKYAGMNTTTHIEQSEDGTLKISIHEAQGYNLCSFNQGVALNVAKVDPDKALDQLKLRTVDP